MHVLGIDVDEQLVERWLAWIAPALQPFVVPADEPAPAGARLDVELGLELCDT
jgi:hypothetical protein